MPSRSPAVATRTLPNGFTYADDPRVAAAVAWACDVTADPLPDALIAWADDWSGPKAAFDAAWDEHRLGSPLPVHTGDPFNGSGLRQRVYLVRMWETARVLLHGSASDSAACFAVMRRPLTSRWSPQNDWFADPGSGPLTVALAVNPRTAPSLVARLVGVLTDQDLLGFFAQDPRPAVRAAAVSRVDDPDVLGRFMSDRAGAVVTAAAGNPATPAAAIGDWLRRNRRSAPASCIAAAHGAPVPAATRTWVDVLSAGYVSHPNPLPYPAADAAVDAGDWVVPGLWSVVANPDSDRGDRAAALTGFLPPPGTFVPRNVTRRRTDLYGTFDMTRAGLTVTDAGRETFDDAVRVAVTHPTDGPTMIDMLTGGDVDPLIAVTAAIWDPTLNSARLLLRCVHVVAYEPDPYTHTRSPRGRTCPVDWFAFMLGLPQERGPRNRLRPPDLPTRDRRALAVTATTGNLVARLANDPDPVAAHVALANPYAPAPTLLKAATHPDPAIRRTVAHAPKASADVLAVLSDDPDPTVRDAVQARLVGAALA